MSEKKVESARYDKIVTVDGKKKTVSTSVLLASQAADLNELGKVNGVEYKLTKAE